MATFYQEIYKLVTDGLNDLTASQQAGKTPKNPLSETHFLSAWVTKMIKQQGYDHCVVDTLVSWQKQARSMGKNAQMKQQFLDIQRVYAGIPREGEVANPVTQAQFVALYDALEQADWIVATEYEVNRKVTHHTDGQGSLVVCAAKAKLAFAEDGELVKPLSLFVRGDVKQILAEAYKQGLLLYKVTDYKSIVKYHGEYIVYPHNGGTHLPEIPAE